MNKPNIAITLPPLLRGALCTLPVLLVGTLALAAAYCHTTLPADICHALQLPLLWLAALVGAFAAARATGRRGLIQGLRVAAILLIALVALTLLTATINPVALTIKAIVIIIGGVLGGILGVF